MIEYMKNLKYSLLSLYFMENLDDWRKAGKITGQTLSYGRTLIKKGASYLEVTEKIEKKIAELGGQCAFPPQMALNDVAAHFTVEPGQDIIVDDQIISLDCGIHVNGAIGDSAITVDLSGRNAALVKASEEALQAALKTLKSGNFRLGAIGKAIEDAITARGFQPVRNLSGHGLKLFEVHAPPTIPNYDTKDATELKKDACYAIEPFATTGAGLIYEQEDAQIFSFVEKRPVRSQITREILKEIEAYKGLPFTTRWLAKKHPVFKVNFALKELIRAGVLHSYPPLPDKSHGLVSQAEHSIYIDSDGKIEILTLRDDE